MQKQSFANMEKLKIFPATKLSLRKTVKIFDFDAANLSDLHASFLCREIENVTGIEIKKFR